jgi:protein-tyrosine kinase
MKMSSAELAIALRPQPLIGKLMMQLGLLSEQDVTQVLEMQHRERLHFGQTAVLMKLITEADMQFALARQFGYSYLRQDSGASQVSDEVVAARDPFSPAVDQLRAIRSQLMLRWYDKAHGRNVLAIVGAESGGGRSYLAANLATVFSQAGESTLLIDADLRTPRQHTLLGVGRRMGLSSVIAGQPLGDAIVAIRGMSGLYLLPAGPRPPNPLELLSGTVFADLLEQVHTTFDCVIVDTSALATGEDAAFVARRAGGALAVARSHVTRVPAFSKMLRGLSNSGVNLVGTVWNDLPRPKSS